MGFQDIRDYLAYNPETGDFHWIKPRTNRVKVGDKAGYMRPDGYCLHRCMGKCYYAHRLAWWFVHGEMPPAEIDHINGNPSDNRIANLRLATHAENHKNRRAEVGGSSRYKGVSLFARTGRWKAEVVGNGQSKYLGYFDTELQAAKAYDLAAFALHGSFARLNFHSPPDPLAGMTRGEQ